MYSSQTTLMHTVSCVWVYMWWLHCSDLHCIGLLYPLPGYITGLGDPVRQYGTENEPVKTPNDHWRIIHPSLFPPLDVPQHRRTLWEDRGSRTPLVLTRHWLLASVGSIKQHSSNWWYQQALRISHYVYPSPLWGENSPPNVVHKLPLLNV